MSTALVMPIPAFHNIQLKDDDFRLIGACLLEGVRVQVRTAAGEEWGSVSQRFGWTAPQLAVVTESGGDERVNQADILAVDLASVTPRAFKLLCSYFATLSHGRGWWPGNDATLVKKYEGTWSFGGDSFITSARAHTHRNTLDNVVGLFQATTDREALVAICARLVAEPTWHMNFGG